MPISILPLASGTLTASAVNSIFQKLEDFINGGIDSTDIDTSTKWCKERKVVRPEFYGSPAPKTLLASSDLHVRYVGDNLYTFVVTNDISGQDYLPIPGLSATIYADLNQEESSTCLGIVNACWFCLEKEALGTNRNSGLDDGTNNNLTHLQVENDDALAATFALYVNGVKQTGTERYLYWNYDGFAFKNHSVSAMITLNRGMNDISIRVKAEADGSSPFYFYQIMIRERNMNIEVIYR